MRPTKDAIKELGKLFYNIALLVIGAVIIHPAVGGKLTFGLLFWGLLGFVLFVVLGLILISLGDKLEN